MSQVNWRHPSLTHARQAWLASPLTRAGFHYTTGPVQSGAAAAGREDRSSARARGRHARASSLPRGGGPQRAPGAAPRAARAGVPAVPYVPPPKNHALPSLLPSSHF
jgi:hypothetical protein